MEKFAALAVCLAPLLYFFPATRGQIVLCPDDGWAFYLPMRVVATHIALNRQFPLWNPHIFGGMPLFAAIQGGVLFPLNWGFLIFSPQPAMNIAVITAYMIAGLGAFCYARRAGANLSGAIITGFIWQASGFLIAQIGHTSSVQTASLLPWVLWSIDGYGMTGQRGRAVSIALFVALQIFAGHPQTFIYSLILAGIYALVMALTKRPVRRFYLYSLALIIVGIALAMVQLLPVYELSRYSFRGEINYEFFSSLSLPPSFLLNFFAPYISGGGDGRFFQMPYTGADFYAEYIGYVGVTTLMLAVVAPFIKRDALTIFWSIVALICLALAFGGFLPFNLYRLVYYIPPLNLFRVPARHLMEVNFALAVLAGRALTVIVSAPDKINAKKLTLIGAGAFALTLFGVLVWRHRFLTTQNARPFDGWRVPEVWCPIIVAATGALALWMLARKVRGANALLLVVIVCDLSLWGQFSGWRSSPARDSALWRELPAVNFLHQRQYSEDQLRILSLVAPPDPNVSGAAAQLQIRETTVALEPNYYMLHDIQNAAGYDAFGLERFGHFADMKEWGELNHPAQSLTSGRAFDLLNVRYLVAKQNPDGAILTANHVLDEKSLVGHWRCVAQFDDVAIYQNLQTLPRAWLATKTFALASDDALNVVHKGKFADGNLWDARRAVLLETSLNVNLTSENAENRAVITNYTPNRIDIKTDCAASSVLVLAENYYPGWRVKVDKREQEILRVDYNLRGVALPPGTHEVEFSYRPNSFLLGTVISILTLIVLLFWWQRADFYALRLLKVFRRK